MRIIYRVSSGENLSDICKKYNTTKEEVIKINDLVSEELKEGYELIMPNNESDFAILKNVDKEVFVEVTLVNIDNIKQIMSNNKVVASSVVQDGRVGDKIIVKQSRINKPKVHIVKPMETIHIISNKYNIDKNDIVQKNNLNTTRLFVGQILEI